MMENKIFSFKVSKEGEENVLWLCFKNGMINLNALADSKPEIIRRRLQEAIVNYVTENSNDPKE